MIFIAEILPSDPAGVARELLVRNPDGSCSLTQVPRLEADKLTETGTLSF